MLSNIKKKALILLVGIILFLNNTVYSEQLDGETENKFNAFTIYGKRAPKVSIPPGWKKELYPVNRIPSWAHDKNVKYLIFKKSYLDLIYPNTFPGEDELAKTLEIFVSLGEFEPTTFCIKALKDIKSFRINVSDLINKNKDSVIDKSNIDVRIVKFFPQVIGKKKYKLFPLILEDNNSLNVNKGLTQQYWLTIYVPEDTIAGEYFGKIILQADGISDKELILKVDVLPFKLKEPNRAYGVYYHMDTRWKGFHSVNVDKHFIDMKKHGLNTIALYVVPYLSKNIEGINIDFSRAGKYRPWSMNELLKKYIDAGFDKTLIYMGLDSLVKHRIKTDLGYKTFSREYDEAFSFIVREIKKEQLLKNWPNFLFSPSDEPADNWDRMKMCKYYLRLFKEVLPDSKTYLTLNGKKKGVDDGTFFDAWLDIRCYAFIDEKLIKETREADDELWVYNGGSIGRNPAKDRFFYGFYAEKISADGVMQWAYQWPRTLKASPYTEMKHGEQGWYYAYPSIDGPLPTIGWEGLREGIDDAKYLYTLNYLIDKAKKSGSSVLLEKAVEAEEIIESILSNIRVDFHAKNKFNNLMYDKWRRVIANKIIEFHNLLQI